MGRAGVVATTTMDDSFDFEAEIDAKDALKKATLKAEGVITAADGSSTTGRRGTVCRHWLRNLCVKGDKCDYLHVFDPNKMPECMWWLKTGKCNDPDCSFRHVKASERPECQKYRRGFCKLGPMCRSRHDRLPRDSIPEVLPDWFLDALLLNSHLIPKAEDVCAPTGQHGRDRNGSSSNQLALMPMSAEEMGTVPGLPAPIHGKCRYYVMRSISVQNIQISASKGIWATSVGNSQRLRQSLRDVDHVILVFAATESRNFCGYAKMLAEPDDRLYSGIWGDMSSRLCGNIRVHWIKQCEVNVNRAAHIKNPHNEDLPVLRCRDGQDLAPTCGETLCRFLWQQPNIDICRGSNLEFEPKVSYELPYDPAREQTRRQEDRQELPSAPRAGSIAEGSKANVAASAPLALEDASASKAGEAGGGPARPAPVRMGTFQNDGSWKSVAHGPAASGSSSLMAAMKEDAQHHEPHHYDRHRPPQAPMGWPGPPPGWRPPPMELRPQPGYGYPPPGYYPPGYGAPPPFDPRFAAPPPAQAPAEAHPPGFWGSEQQQRASLPPDGWQGASAAVEPQAREKRSHRHGSRSRSRAKKEEEASSMRAAGVLVFICYLCRRDRKSVV